MKQFYFAKVAIVRHWTLLESRTEKAAKQEAAHLFDKPKVADGHEIKLVKINDIKLLENLDVLNGWKKLITKKYVTWKELTI